LTWIKSHQNKETRNGSSRLWLPIYGRRALDKPLLKALLARSVGIVSAAISSVSSGGTGTDRSSSDAYRHSAAYGCPTVDATAIDTAVINASATNSNASSICEGVSWNSRDARDADDNGCSKRNDGSTRHDQSPWWAGAHCFARSGPM